MIQPLQEPRKNRNQHRKKNSNGLIFLFSYKDRSQTEFIKISAGADWCCVPGAVALALCNLKDLTQFILSSIRNRRSYSPPNVPFIWAMSAKVLLIIGSLIADMEQVGELNGAEWLAVFILHQ